MRHAIDLPQLRRTLAEISELMLWKTRGSVRMADGSDTIHKPLARARAILLLGLIWS